MPFAWHTNYTIIAKKLRIKWGSSLCSNFFKKKTIRCTLYSTIPRKLGIGKRDNEKCDLHHNDQIWINLYIVDLAKQGAWKSKPCLVAIKTWAQLHDFYVSSNDCDGIICGVFEGKERTTPFYIRYYTTCGIIKVVTSWEMIRDSCGCGQLNGIHSVWFIRNVVKRRL